LPKLLFHKVYCRKSIGRGCWLAWQTKNSVHCVLTSSKLCFFNMKVVAML